MDDDQLQTQLERWTRDRDQRAGRKAVSLARAEWAPRVCSFVRGTRTYEPWEDVLEALVVDLLGPRDGRACRALAPAGTRSPRAFRYTVLQRALLDWAKSIQRQRRRDERVDVESLARSETGRPPAGVGESDDFTPDTSIETRARIRTLLTQLEPRERLLVGFEMGFDLSVWHDELSTALDIDLDRLNLAMESPRNDTALAALLFPKSPRDSFQKAKRRAMEKARTLIEGES